MITSIKSEVEKGICQNEYGAVTVYNNYVKIPYFLRQSVACLSLKGLTVAMDQMFLCNDGG